MSTDRTALVCATVLVAAGLLAGFAMMGSPGHARGVQLDARRIEDLRAIVARIDARYGDGHRWQLPSRLPANLDPRRRDGTFAGADPVTRLPYAYGRIDGRHYRLCAIFATASSLGDQGYGSWPHASGRVCYRFELGRPLDGWPPEVPEVDQSAQLALY